MKITIRELKSLIREAVFAEPVRLGVSKYETSTTHTIENVKLKRSRRLKNLYGSALYKAIIAKCDAQQKIKFQRFVSRLENDETDPLTDEEIDDKIRAWYDRNIYEHDRADSV